jgi:hypothetical protein
VDFAECAWQRPPAETLRDEFTAFERAQISAEVLMLKLIDDVNDYITAYAAPRCLEICQNMQAKLPPELRDLVYSMLFGPKNDLTIGTRDMNMFSKIGQPQRDSPFCCTLAPRAGPLENPAYAHLFDPRFADPTTIAEFLASWYSMRNFLALVEDVDTFLQHDRWGCGDLPTQAVRMITVDLFLPPKDVGIIPQEIARLRHDATIALYLCVDKWTREGVLMYMQNLSVLFPSIKQYLNLGYSLVVAADDLHDFDQIRFDVKANELTVEHWMDKMYSQ